MNPQLLRVTNRIIERSRETRSAYLARIEQAKTSTVHRSQLACGNLAHGFAACQPEDKASLKSMLRNNIAIITSYNDMLSAHQPYEHYPEIIRKALHEANAVGQVAGGVPAMCDGVTQGQDGMELSLLSREVIAMSAAVALPRIVQRRLRQGAGEVHQGCAPPRRASVHRYRHSGSGYRCNGCAHGYDKDRSCA